MELCVAVGIATAVEVVSEVIETGFRERKECLSSKVLPAPMLSCNTGRRTWYFTCLHDNYHTMRDSPWG